MFIEFECLKIVFFNWQVGNPVEHRVYGSQGKYKEMKKMEQII